MPKINLPAMRRQKRPNGRHDAYVNLHGKRVLLGLWGSAEAAEHHVRLVAEWLARGRTEPVHRDDLTVSELAAAFAAHSMTEYPDSTSVRDRVRLSLAPLCRLYASLPCSEFGPVALKCVREAMIDSGLSLTSVNARVATIKAAFRYGAENEMISGEVQHRVQALANLKRGRSRCKQPRAVHPANPRDVAATLPHLPRDVAAAVQLQRLTGARASEVLGLRGADIDMTGPVWVAHLARHKTAHHGKPRVLCFGPKAQAILKPLILRRRPEEFLISPRSHFEERREHATTPRRPNQAPTPRKTQQHVGERYQTAAYGRCIRRACLKAGVTPWSSHQLRHLAATELRAAYGCEVARACLGHTNLKVTEIYAEADMSIVSKVMGELG